MSLTDTQFFSCLILIKTSVCVCVFFFLKILNWKIYLVKIYSLKTFPFSIFKETKFNWRVKLILSRTHHAFYCGMSYNLEKLHGAIKIGGKKTKTKINWVRRCALMKSGHVVRNTRKYNENHTTSRVFTRRLIMCVLCRR